MLALIVGYITFKYILNFLYRLSKKAINTKFHENPSGRSRVVLTPTDRQTRHR